VYSDWADEEAEKLFNRQRSRKLPPDLQRVTLRKLLMLDGRRHWRTPRPTGKTGWRSSRRPEGQWSIRINTVAGSVHVSDGNAHDVEIVDYH